MTSTIYEWAHYLSKNDVVDTIVFGCGMVDGLGTPDQLINRPFMSLYLSCATAGTWVLCSKLLRWSGFPARCNFLIPVFALVSCVGLKLRGYNTSTLLESKSKSKKTIVEDQAKRKTSEVRTV
jgi:hypothetical protein